jgi:hypothetical protein
MKKILIVLVAGSLVIAAGCSNGVAQEEEASEPAVPVELYACNYNEGMGPADLDAASAKWNAWADERGLNDYTAWTLTKFYSGPEQEFDVIWLGVSPTAKAMGAAHDDYLANGTEIEAGFAEVLTCDAHANFASVQFKAPPEREDPPDNVVISFSDCNIAEGKSFDNDVAPAIRAWVEYRTEQGSEAGRWVLFPAYGGGGEELIGMRTARAGIRKPRRSSAVWAIVIPPACTTRQTDEERWTAKNKSQEAVKEKLNITRGMKDPVSAGFFFFNERLLLAVSCPSISLVFRQLNDRFG